MNDRVKVIVADITKIEVDAIVNAANEGCLGGGGVDGAIHRAAGPALRRECLKLAEVSPGVRCPTGEARITDAGNLPCRKVIHTVGPDCRECTDEMAQNRLLASAYSSSLELARANGLKTIAFPSISTGVFGFPLERAARIAASVIVDFLARVPDMSVTMCILNPRNPDAQAEDMATYQRAFDECPMEVVVSYQSGTGNGDGVIADPQMEDPSPMTLGRLVRHYRRANRVLERYHLRGLAKSLGEVYGVKCVKPGDWHDGEFELHTSLGEFRIVRDCYTDLGLLDVELEGGCCIGYTDIRLVVAFGFLGFGRFDGDYEAYRFGDAYNGTYQVKNGFDEGQWIELRGMSEEWAWNVAHRMGFPSCLDRFTHFCRDRAWIDEYGDLVLDPNEMMNLNEMLLRMGACCLNNAQYVEGWKYSDVVSRELMDNLLALKRILKERG